jgi:hypothetical protein
MLEVRKEVMLPSGRTFVGRCDEERPTPAMIETINGISRTVFAPTIVVVLEIEGLEGLM